MKRLVLLDVVDFDKFENWAKEELPMMLEGAEFKHDDYEYCMFVDDNQVILDAAKAFLRANNIRFVIAEAE